MQAKQATAAKASLVYLTIGGLTVVWSVIYYLYLQRTGGADLTYLWCYGFFFSGIVLSIIGLGVGRIGRSALQAEPPPPTVAVTPAPTTVVESPARPATAAPAPPVPVAPAGVAPAAPGSSTAPAAPVFPAQVRR
jgi:hypothetical protein